MDELICKFFSFLSCLTNKKIQKKWLKKKRTNLKSIKKDFKNKI